MAITPTTTIVASPQAGSDRFFFWQIGNDLQNDWGSGPAGIFTNGSDQYIVLFHCVNFGVVSDSQHWQYSVFKNGTQQDSANEPLVVNPSSMVDGKQYSPNICVQQIGTDLYIIYWNRTGHLEITVFHMATDLFGSTFTSTLTPGTGPTVATGSSGASDGGFISTYNANTDKITIINSGFSIPISGQDYQRPAFVQYTVGTNTFGGSFAIIGHDDSVVFPESCYGGAALDCRGATNFTISQYDTDTPVLSIFFQSVYADGSLSAVQDTGATATGQPASCQEACGAILCTGTEFVIPYNTQRAGFSLYRDGINVVRATVPLTDTLPLSWTIQAVHATGGAMENVQGIRLFKVGTDLVLPYTGLTVADAGTQIACAVWDGATWTDGATLGSPLTVLMVRGTNGATTAIITYDFTATATDVVGTNKLSGVANEIFSFVSLTEPDCEIPSISIACPIDSAIAEVGVLFTSTAPVVTGDTPPDTFVLLSGPGWMSIDAATGIVSGIPDATGSITYTIQVTDDLGNIATTDPGCDLTVSPEPIVIACPTTPTVASQGVPFTSAAPIVTDGTPPYTFTLISGPGWLSINATTGVVSGTPPVSGVFSYVIEVNDAFDQTADTSSCPLTTRCPATFLPGRGGNRFGG